MNQAILNMQMGGGIRYIRDNLLDDVTWTSGSYVNWTNGNITANAIYSYTDTIPVEPNTSYFLQGMFDGNGAGWHIVFFNSSNAFLAGYNSVLTCVTSPATASYARCSLGTAARSHPYTRPGLFKTTSAMLRFGCIGDSVTAQHQWTNRMAYNLRFNLGATSFGNVLGVGGSKYSGTSATEINNDARINALASNCEVVALFGGINDWAQNVPLGSVDSTDFANDMHGGLNVSVTKMQARFPTQPLIILTPLMSRLPNRAGWTDTYGLVNNLGLTAVDYAQAIEARAISLGLNYVKLYDLWNDSNLTTYTISDGGFIHPNEAGGNLVGERISKKLYSLIYSLRPW